MEANEWFVMLSIVYSNFNCNYYHSQEKSKMASWAVSNCETVIHREKYIEKLQEYLNVDVYSKKECLSGRKSFECPPDTADVHMRNNAKCYTNISTKYWFYLAFESR